MPTTLNDVANLLVRQTGAFLTTSMFRESVNILEPMTEEFVLTFLTTFVDTFDEKMEPDVAEGIMNRVKVRAPNTLKSLLGSNKKYYDVKGKNRTPGNLLAILVDFTNFSVLPMDLAVNCGDFSVPVFEESTSEKQQMDMQGLAIRKVHEHAWFEIATRVAGSEPPFVPLDGRSMNLDDADNQELTEFFLQGKYLTWATGIGSIEVCDTMVREARSNGNFDSAYRIMERYNNGQLTEAQLRRPMVPALRFFPVRGRKKERKPDPDCKNCRGSGIEVSGNRGEDEYPCDCIKLR